MLQLHKQILKCITVAIIPFSYYSFILFLHTAIVSFIVCLLHYHSYLVDNNARLDQNVSIIFVLAHLLLHVFLCVQKILLPKY